MAGAGIKITGDEQVISGLRAATETLENPFEMYTLIGAHLAQTTKERFDQGMDPDGNPWPASIRVLVNGGNTLVDSRALRDSITYEADASGVEVGTNVIYAATHQFGATITAKSAGALRFNIPGVGFITKQSVTIPARPFLGMNAEDEVEIGAIITDQLAAAFGGGVDAR